MNSTNIRHLIKEKNNKGKAKGREREGARQREFLQEKNRNKKNPDNVCVCRLYENSLTVFTLNLTFQHHGAQRI